MEDSMIVTGDFSSQSPTFSPEISKEFREMSVDSDKDDMSVPIAFAKALDIHQAGDERAIDLIRRYGELSSNAAKNRLFINNSEEAKDKLLETRFWSLIFNLYSYRLSTIESMLEVPKYASNILAVEKYLLDHPASKENWIILEWLQNNFDMPEPPKDVQGKWLYTKHLVQKKNLPHMQAPRAGGMFGGMKLDENMQNVVSELDADAPIRQSKNISKEDANFDRGVYRYVFELLRANQITKALDFCAETGNWSLRLAISGTYEYLDGVIDGAELNVENDDYEGKGSENRALWRHACGAVAEGASDSYEKGVYGILSGDLDSVLNLSDTWETQFYAYMSHIVACEGEKILVDCGRINLEKIMISNSGRLNGRIFSVQEVLDTLSRSQNPVVRKQSQDRYRVLMGSAIEKSISPILTQLAGIYTMTRDEDFDHDLLDDFDLLRVVIHFVLFLKNANTDIGDEESFSILVKAYVTYLALEKLDNLAPLYISYLPYTAALDVYSSLLADITDFSQRKEHLSLGKKYQLDMNNTVRQAVAKIFKDTEHAYLPNEENTQFMDVLDDNDQLRINGVQWFVDAGLWSDAVHSSVYAYRDFLSCGKYAAARALGSRINVTSMINTYKAKESAYISDSDSPSVPAEELYELGEYEHLVEYFQQLETWETHFRSIPSENMGSLVRQLPQDWLTVALRLVNQLGEMVYNVTDNWMFHVRYLIDSPEWKLLDQLRTMYVPFIIMSYLVVLTNARVIHSKFLKEAADLATLVADENFKRYVLFIRSGCLQEFLRKVSIAITDGLESGAVYDKSS